MSVDASEAGKVVENNGGSRSIPPSCAFSNPQIALRQPQNQEYARLCVASERPSDTFGYGIRSEIMRKFGNPSRRVDWPREPGNPT